MGQSISGYLCVGNVTTFRDDMVSRPANERSELSGSFKGSTEGRNSWCGRTSCEGEPDNEKTQGNWYQWGNGDGLRLQQLPKPNLVCDCIRVQPVTEEVRCRTRCRPVGCSVG